MKELKNIFKKMRRKFIKRNSGGKIDRDCMSVQRPYMRGCVETHRDLLLWNPRWLTYERHTRSHVLAQVRAQPLQVNGERIKYKIKEI